MSSNDKREGQREDAETGAGAAPGQDETTQSDAEARAVEDAIEDAEVLGETGPDGEPVTRDDDVDPDTVTDPDVGLGADPEADVIANRDPDAPIDAAQEETAPDPDADLDRDAGTMRAAEAEEAAARSDDAPQADDLQPDDRTEAEAFAASEFPEQDREIAETGTPPQGDGTERSDPLPDEPDGTRPHAPEDAAPASAVSAQPGTESAGAVPPASPPPQAAPAPEKRGGVFFPALLGGVIAAGAGFAVAEYDLVAALTGEERADPVQQSLDAQADRLGGLEDQIARIADAMSDPAADPLADRIEALSGTLEARLDDVAARIDGASDRIAAVEQELGQSIASVRDDMGESIDGIEATLQDVGERLTAVEQRPLQESSETARQAFAAYEREVEALQEALAEQREAAEEAAAAMEERAEEAQAEVDAAAEEAAAAQAAAEEEARAAAEEAQARAEAVERAAATRESLARLDAAIERGDPFQAALERLSGYADIPPTLAEHAAGGVTPLPQLRQQFPDLAREALDASIRATVDEDYMSRMGAFLRTQTGARSLTPKEGDDPDAVLSRAEAALREGDLEAAVAEIGALPEAGQQVLSQWTAEAETRAAVVAAADNLRATLSAN